MSKRFAFEPYTTHDPGCAVVAVTPPDRPCLHTYYDIRPWSPTGRYLVCLSPPFEDHRPRPTDTASICVVDLAERTIETVHETSAWGFQTGAHQMWGADDHTLFFNMRREGLPVGGRLDLATGKLTTLDGPIWTVSPDQNYAISPCLVRANLTQPEYGIAMDPADQIRNTVRANPEDGLFRVDLRTGRQTLLVSLPDVWAVLPDRGDLEKTILYGFHAKIDPTGRRIMFVVRAQKPDGGYLPMLLTCRPDGSELRVTVPHRVWARGGHHPVWYPDGEHVLMNLTPQGDAMRFCLVAVDGTIRPLLQDADGSGHPIANPDRSRMVTDVQRESGGRRHATARLFDLPSGEWQDLCTLESPHVSGDDVPLRRDAHITWDQEGRRLLCLAAPSGPRQLFVLDPSLPPGQVPEF